MEAIGPYRILEGPFKGGFGEVFKVFDGDSGDEFALKTLQGGFLSGSDALLRFRAEIKVWIDLPVHPHVVRAIKAFDHGGRPYVVMEWVGGGDLRGFLARRPSSVEVLEVMQHIAAGMAHIHRQGLVHGDLKPENILIWGGACAQVSDFGFARASGSQALRAVGGTERYLAPEARGGVARTASDIYAAGVTLLEMLESLEESSWGFDEAHALAAAMTETDPDLRPVSFDDVQLRLSTLLERAPSRPTILVRSGDRLTWEERHVHAVPELAALDAARSLLVVGRRAEAREKLESALATNPEFFTARLLLAHCFYEDGELEACFEQAFAARALVNGNPEALADIGLIMASIDRLEDADDIRQQLPDGPLKWHLAAAISQRNGDLSEAIDCFEKAIAGGATRDLRLGLAEVLREAGLLDRAIAELKAIGADHHDLGAKATFQLARAYVDCGLYEDAANELRACLRTDHGPEIRAYAYGELGYLYRKEGLLDAAIASYEKALEIEPTDRAMQEGLALSRGEPAFTLSSVDELDACTIYTTLATLEKRFEADRFEDIIEGIVRVGWRLMLDELVIPRMRRTKRISDEEADVLERARTRARVEPERGEDGIEIYADVYELLLALRSVFDMFGARAFRGHHDHRFRLVPSLYRGARAELPQRIQRTLSFTSRLASLDRYRAVVEADDPDSIFGMVAIAQHCGMPSALLEFTSDARIALSLATIDGRVGEIGELLVLDPAEHPVFVGEENPYGVFLSAAPAPSIERMKSTFLEGMTLSVLHDPDTTFVERYRFRQNGRRFAGAGGYDSDELTRGVRDLYEEVKGVAQERALPSQFANELNAYFDYLARAQLEEGDSVSKESYVRACASLVHAEIENESVPSDRKAALVYLSIQHELRERGIAPRGTRHASRVRHAMNAYLSASGTIAQRIGSGLGTWLGRAREHDELVLEIAERAFAKHFDSSDT